MSELDSTLLRIIAQARTLVVQLLGISSLVWWAQSALPATRRSR